MTSSSAGHVLITGASRGLGAAFVRAFAERGHPVTLLARDEAAIHALATDLESRGLRAAAIACDVTDPAMVEKAFDHAVAKLGPLSIVVNNAGVVLPVSIIANTPPEAWADHIGVNLVGAFNVLHYAVPRLAAGAIVVNVSSGAALEPMVGRSAYCAGKAGLNMLSSVLALEEGPRGLRVHAFTPGPSDTETHVLIRSAAAVQRIPTASRQLQPAADAARFLLWLTSDAAADLAGRFVSSRDPVLRERAGMPPVRS